MAARSHAYTFAAGNVLPIRWHPFREFGSRQTPFDRTTSASQLRLTFDDKSLSHGRGVEAEAAELLRGFAASGLVDGIGFEPSEIPHLIVTREGERRIVCRSDGQMVPFDIELPERADLSLSTLYGGDPRRSEVVELFDAFARVQPHLALRRDILVSLDQALLEAVARLVEPYSPSTASWPPRA